MAYNYYAVCKTCRQARRILRTQAGGLSSPLAEGKVVGFWWWLAQHVGELKIGEEGSASCVVEIMGDHEIDALDYEVDFCGVEHWN